MAEIPEIKLFGKWSLEDIEIQDISLTVSFSRACSRQTRRHVDA